MKKILVAVCLIAFSLSCKQKEEKAIKEISIAQKIANAHGFENWNTVSEIQFTFFNKRSWVWKPKTNAVTLITEKDTINYNRKALDSLSVKADRAFINDKFWLLIPFQLVWDQGTTISKQTTAQSPIHKIQLNKITLTYPDTGGYTPGDAYDIYYDNDFIIKEWAFRKGNANTTGLINTFENHQDFYGIKIALDHKKAEGNWNLTLTGIKIKKE
ncbi:hypothetical protein FPF71_11040 [Algibacter amylolyticus]|uniref:Uncharacterized protein n=1 Tax=Algibacter amylolyticus TaxID=1608400 RepID=A0A5M7B402_9FLAO|nr:hypothetical protein [Algibacter amylolyticus]KAA5824142.1 hypothetical protein F2B50_11040 [Algibacter amylolyticus]MBB5269700.1 hypothetical protein [Algibacter amylolyticus]TSJ74619.1 hypothetical protein FPF71_11040 [Algibacter amylolyticus]